MKLKNICLSGNEHGQLKPDVIYADLYNDVGELVISSTLDYILAAIRERKYQVEGVSVKWFKSKRPGSKGVKCSEVSLDLYS
jgi:hypothetical protein